MKHNKVVRSFRRAEEGEHRILTEISFRSKSYWQYPQSYISIWEPELTITREYIGTNKVFVCSAKEETIGYYSLVMLSQDKEFSGRILQSGWWLDHMFVVPEHIGTGVGREMFSHCLAQLLKENAARLMILADPFALNFYLKMGCVYIDAYPSTIPGRTTPYLEYPLDT